MGCITSSLQNPNHSTSKNSSKPLVKHSSPSDSSNSSNSSDEGQFDILDNLKDYDKSKSILCLEETDPESPTSNGKKHSNNDSIDILLDGGHINKSTDESAADLIHKRARRKAAKLRAEAEKRWMIFTNLDTVSKSDLVYVTHFMQTVVPLIPDLFTDKRKTIEVLNMEDEIGPAAPLVSIKEDGEEEDDSTIQPRRRNSASVLIARKNSQSFIKALSDIRKTQDIIRKCANTDLDPDTARSDGSKHSRSSFKERTSNLDSTKSGSASLSSTPRSLGQFSPQPVTASEMEGIISAKRGKSDFALVSRSNSLQSVQSTFLRDTSQSSVHSNHSQAFTFENIALSSELEKSTTLEAIIPDEELLAYELPKGGITPYTVDLVIALYKKGGRLSPSSMHKILRHSYKILKAAGNIQHIPMASTDRVTVVGDLHGQLADLLYILEDSGLPGKTSKYVFNGDFVDRGPEGVEIVAVLLSLFCAFPGLVCLNRGNHEDFAVCCAYGFQQECRSKYNNLVFGMFVEVFAQLPLFTIIDNAVMVVHGGLFHCTDVTISDLESIDRTNFALTDIHHDGESTSMVPRNDRVEFSRQLQRDALWSDPSPDPGLQLNPRGAGVAFGPDVTKAFLDANGLKMVVRSHECVRTGFAKHFLDSEYAGLLVTVFSASNYYGQGNTAAYMVFDKSSFEDPKYDQVKGCDLRYYVSFYLTDGGDDEEDAKTTVGEISHSLGQTLYDFILDNKIPLLHEFQTHDKLGTGYITRDIWAGCMQHVCKFELYWDILLSTMMSRECQDIINIAAGDEPLAVVYYLKFLDRFNATHASNYVDVATEDKSKEHDLLNKIVSPHEDRKEADKNDITASTWRDTSGGHIELGEVRAEITSDAQNELIGETSVMPSSAPHKSNAAPANRELVPEEALVDEDDEDDKVEENEDLEARNTYSLSGGVVESLYSQHRLLEDAFRYFDRNANGTISAAEFRKGCDSLNSLLSKEEKIMGIDEIISALDITDKVYNTFLTFNHIFVTIYL